MGSRDSLAGLAQVLPGGAFLGSSRGEDLERLVELDAGQLVLLCLRQVADGQLQVLGTVLELDHAERLDHRLSRRPVISAMVAMS